MSYLYVNYHLFLYLIIFLLLPHKSTEWAVDRRMCVFIDHEELWEFADPSAAMFSSWRWGHAHLPDPLRVSGSARLQKLHLSHHPARHGHPPAGRQPQQSARYDTTSLMSHTPNVWPRYFNPTCFTALVIVDWFKQPCLSTASWSTGQAECSRSERTSSSRGSDLCWLSVTT